MADRKAIETCLEKILATTAFRNSKRNSELLTYLVFRTLDNKGDEITGTTIAQDVFKKGAEFDASNDPHVRVTVGRLRKALEEYYSGEGSSDSHRIEIPKGSYQAKFVENLAVAHTQEDEAPLSGERLFSGFSFNRYKLVVLSMLAVLVLISALFMISNRSTTARDFADVDMSISTGPKLFINQFRYDGVPELASSLPGAVHIQFIDQLSRFKDSFVFGPYANVSISETFSENMVGLGAPTPEYLIEGRILLESERITINAQLISAAEGVFVWSQSYTRDFNSPEQLSLVVNQMVSEVAATLGQPYGVIERSIDNSIARFDGIRMEDYICTLKFNEYAAAKTALGHNEVRTCLEKAVTRSPNYSTGWALLSWMYGDEERYGFNRRSATYTGLKLSPVEAAMNAVRADPNNSVAYLYLSVAHFALGQYEEFSNFSAKSLTLNPNDSEAIASAGQLLLFRANSEEGFLLSQKALQLNPGGPPWFHIGSMVHHYRVKEYDRAWVHLEKYRQDDSALSQLFAVSIAYKMQDQRKAVSAWLELEENFPELTQAPEGMLRQRGLSEDLVTAISEDILSLRSVVYQSDDS